MKEIVDLTRHEQTAGFARVEVLLAGKADKADLIPIHERLSLHDSRLRTLEDGRLVDDAELARVSDQGRIRWNRVGVVAALFTAAGGIGYVILAAIH